LKTIDIEAWRSMTSMVRDRATRLDSDTQARVAAWASTIAVSARFVHRQPSYVAATWTDWLCRVHRPHPNWQVWLGRYTGAHSIWYGARYVRSPTGQAAQAALAASGQEVVHGVLTTLIVGSLLVQVLGMDEAIHVPAPTPAALQPIWPALGVVEWPAQAHYDAATLHGLAERLEGGWARRRPLRSTVVASTATASASITRSAVTSDLRKPGFLPIRNAALNTAPAAVRRLLSRSRIGRDMGVGSGPNSQPGEESKQVGVTD
jgi:hypothetical protein